MTRFVDRSSAIKIVQPVLSSREDKNKKKKDPIEEERERDTINHSVERNKRRIYHEIKISGCATQYDEHKNSNRIRSKH